MKTLAILLSLLTTALAEPVLPSTMGTVSIPSQEWPLKPRPRETMVHVRYPGTGAQIEGVRPDTGIMLSLHNWGGTDCAGHIASVVSEGAYTGVSGALRAAFEKAVESGA